MQPNKLHIKPTQLSKAALFLQSLPSKEEINLQRSTLDYTRSQCLQNEIAEMRGIDEEIYGKLAIGYHRTSEKGMQALSRGRMFKVGPGQTYGPGFYLTYDLDSQYKDNMANQYGEYVIRAKINLDKFLIFDTDVLRKVYPQFKNVKEQLMAMGGFTNFYQMSAIFGGRAITEIENIAKGHSSGYSSDAAYQMASSGLGWLLRNTRGIVFNGRNDGRVIVAYDEKAVTPISYAHLPEGMKPRNPQFIPVQQINKTTLNRSMDVSPNLLKDPIIKQKLAGVMREANSRLKNFRNFNADVDTKEPSGGKPGLKIRFTFTMTDNVTQEGIIAMVMKYFKGWDYKKPRTDLPPGHRLTYIQTGLQFTEQGTEFHIKLYLPKNMPLDTVRGFSTTTYDRYRGPLV